MQTIRIATTHSSLLTPSLILKTETESKLINYYVSVWIRLQINSMYVCLLPIGPVLQLKLTKILISALKCRSSEIFIFWRCYQIESESQCKHEGKLSLHLQFTMSVHILQIDGLQSMQLHIDYNLFSNSLRVIRVRSY